MRHLIVVMLCLTGCSKRAVYDVSAEFEPYVKSFERESVLHSRPTSVTNIVIKFSEDMAFNHVGYCQAGDVPTISIRQYWLNLPELQKERIIFHELGHCVLGRTDLHGSFPATSIMHHSFRVSDYTEQTRHSYLEELFK